MELGAFSVSLAVKDIEKSKNFYSKLGFEVFGGDQSQNWLIMKNKDHVIGLFQGMFEGNAMTFNPGDVRAIQTSMQAAGYVMEKEADGTDGPAHAMIKDPDGNMILLDQF